MDPSFQKANGWVWQETIVGEEHKVTQSKNSNFINPWFIEALNDSNQKNLTFTHDFLNLLTIWINFEISRFQRRIHVLDRDNMIK